MQSKYPSASSLPPKVQFITRTIYHPRKMSIYPGELYLSGPTPWRW
jgi:ubiquitin-protein ligase